MLTDFQNSSIIKLSCELFKYSSFHHTLNMLPHYHCTLNEAHRSECFQWLWHGKYVGTFCFTYIQYQYSADISANLDNVWNYFS